MYIKIKNMIHIHLKSLSKKINKKYEKDKSDDYEL